MDKTDLTLYRHLFDNYRDAIFVVHIRTGEILAANAAASRLLERPRAELVGCHYSRIHPPGEEEKYRNLFETYVALGGGVLEGEIQTSKGEGVAVEISAGKFSFNGEEVIYGEFRDIRSRKRSETELKKLSWVIKSSFDMIVVTDREGIIEYVNPAFERVSGYTREEALGNTPRILKSGRHGLDFYRRLWNTILAGNPFAATFVNKAKNGKFYFEEATISPVTNEEGRPTHFVSVGREITERLSLQDQLIQSQKLEAVGNLAGGIAHDFNNLLTVIKGYSETLFSEFDPEDPRRKDLEEVIHAADRASELTRQILAFSRRQVLQPKVVNLNDVIRNMEKMLRRLIGENIYLEPRLSPSLGQTDVDPHRFEQVLLNLIINARDAMPDGGRVLIETRNMEIDEAISLRHLQMNAGPYVLVEVTDQGTGMDQKTCAQIFEPFFTTKEPGKGTGLGLSTVYGIVKQSGGYIWVYSEVGRGTTFKIYLPRVHPEAAKGPQPPPPPALKRGTETILLVEDDETIRKMVSKILSDNGYKVLLFLPEDNLDDFLNKLREKIDLLLTDVVMPKISGPDLAHQLLDKLPGLRVLYMSGYAANENHAIQGGFPFLQKPFVPRMLLQKVREALE